MVIPFCLCTNLHTAPLNGHNQLSLVHDVFELSPNGYLTNDQLFSRKGKANIYLHCTEEKRI